MILPNIEKLLDNKYLSYSIGGNTLGRYLISTVLLLILLFALRIIKSILLVKVKKITEKTVTKLDDMIISFIDEKLFPLLYYGALYISLIQLNLSVGVSKIITSIGIMFLAIQVTRTLLSILLFVIKDKWGVMLGEGAGNGLLSIVRFLIWGLCIIFILDNLGFNISTVVAGMGIGGVAIALASQNILNDLFNYFVIFFDKPFEPGDFIIIGDFAGTIETIGIKTTRIRSISGEEMVFSNSDLSGSRIRNFKRMQKRRVSFTLGIVYGSSSEAVESIPSMIKEIVNSIPDTEFARCHFKTYNDSSLDFETVYYILNRDYDYFMDIQQQINVKIYKLFNEKSIEFAYPTQTLFLNKDQKENEIDAPTAPSETD